MPLERKSLPSIEYLRECFEFKEGLIFWRSRPRDHFGNYGAWRCFENNYASTQPGVVSVFGYTVVNISCRSYYLHRIVFKMHTGREPFIVDHIDGDRSNNLISNLREATQSQNFYNARMQKNNTNGLKGVVRDKRSGRYRATIRINNKAKHIGWFDTAEDAHEAYYQMALKVAGEFANRG